MDKIGGRSIVYQKIDQNLDEIAQWPDDELLYNVNESALAINTFTKDRINMKIDTKEAYKTRMYIARAPLYQNKDTLKLILKDENADDFVRNINIQVIDDSISKTL